MSMTVQLPPALRDRLAAAARRVRLLRALRGLSWLVLALAVGASAAVLADWATGGLPAALRGVHLAAWLALGGAIALITLIRPLFRPLDPADLACAIEDKHPELAERLTSSVELAQHTGEGNGSPALIALLVQETEARSRPVDFRAGLARRSTLALAGVASLVALAALAPAAVAPTQYGLLVKRFLLPAATPAALPEFDITTTPPGYAAVGRPLDLEATITQLGRAPLPARATLVLIANGTETRQAMYPVEGQPGTYRHGHRVAGDFSYRVEAGNASSATHEVRAIAPVELAADSPVITVTPPTYARKTVEPATLHGLVGLGALKHSEIAFTFRFTRPAVAAELVWTHPGEKPRVERKPLALSPDRTSATLTLPAIGDGTYRVRFEAEQGVATELDGGTVAVKADEPPVMVKFLGEEKSRPARPYDRLPVEARLADDVGVVEAEVLYRKRGETAFTAVKMTLEGADPREALARHTLALAGKVKEGDVLEYKVRFRDGLPPALGGPHVVEYPADRWLEVEIVKQAGSLAEQAARQQRDRVNDKLAKIRAEVLAEQRATYKLRSESRVYDNLTEGQQKSLAALKEQNARVQKALRELAAEAAGVPELERLAEQMRQLASGEMARAGEELDKAGKKREVSDTRDDAFIAADKHLEDALKKLDALRKENERLAQARMDRAKVEELADRQKALAEKAEALAADAPKGEVDQLRKEQGEVAEELRRLTENSPELRKALEAARAAQAKQAADEARALAEAQRDLAAASGEAERKREAARLAEVAKRQQALAERARQLGEQGPRQQKADDAGKAAQSLRDGETDRALSEQDRAAQQLDRMAGNFEQAARAAKDPREAARQLAKWEEDLARRTREEANRPKPDRPLAERLKEVAAEQKALRQAAEKLSLPENRRAAEADRKKAVAALERAEQQLAKGDANAAAKEMDRARQALADAAAKLPTLAERQQQARRQVEQLRRDQEALGRQAGEAAKDEKAGAKKLADAEKKQKALAERLGKLDAAGEEARKERAQEALRRAGEDLKQGRRDDVGASQEAARRELQRLAEALAGQRPADERAADLARRQRELAERADKLAGDPKAEQAKKDDVREAQRRLADEAKGLDAKDAPATKRDASEAAKRAADQAGKDATGKESRQAMRDAAKKLEDLARAMKGQETDAEKARRLADRQAAEAGRAEKDQGAAQKRQRELADEAKGLRGGAQAKDEKRKAQEALDRAANAKGDKERGQAQKEAEKALRDLSDKLAKGQPGERMPADRKMAGEEDKGRAEQARQLAREQRELREQTRRQAEQGQAERRADAEKRDNPAGKLAREQEDIARQAARLARDVAREQGAKAPTAQQAQKTNEAAKQAARDLQAGRLDRAAEQGKQTADGLRQLADDLARTPRGKDQGKVDPLQQARELRQRQEAVNKGLEPLRGDAAAQRAQQRERQGDLAKQADALRERLDRMAQPQGASPQAQAQARDAAEQARQARDAMRQAETQGRQGNQGETQRQREQAAQALDRAAKRAEGAAQQAQQAAGEGQPRAGESLQQARGQMNQARDQLGKGQPGQARQSMQQAAGQLDRAAREMGPQGDRQGQPRPNGEPGRDGMKPGGTPDNDPTRRPDAAQLKRWGELPGELQSKVLQEMKAKYGEDYARLIKLYFEQIADTKKSR